MIRFALRYLAILALFTCAALAQVPQPQVPIGGTIGENGINPLLPSGDITATDANYTLAYPNTAGVILSVNTSAWTAARTWTLPSTVAGFSYDICNIGGSYQMNIAPSSSLSIAAGACSHIRYNGTNYVAINPPSSSLSGMTAGQIPIAASPTTVASSKPILGSGADVPSIAPGSVNAAYLGTNSSGTVTPVSGPASNSILPGYNTYINFAAQGSGTTGVDLSGSGNTCTLHSGSTWTTGGITMGTSAGYLNSCQFPASTSLSDNSTMNARTLTWCGYKAIFNQSNYPVYSAVFGGSNQNNIGSLWLSGIYIRPRESGYMGIYSNVTQNNGTGSATPETGWHCLTWTMGSSTDSTLDHLYIDDSEAYYSVRAPGSGTQFVYDLRQSGDYYTLGLDAWNGTNDWILGISSAVLTYPTILSPSQVANNWHALQYVAFYQYGVDVPTAVSATSNNIIDTNGDSISAPGNPVSVVSYPALIGTSAAPLNTSFQVNNNAQASNLIYNIISDEPQVDIPQLSRFSEFTFASNAGGINDLNIAGYTAANVIQARISWAKTMQSIGYQVIMPTMIDSASQSTNVETINAGLRVYSQQNPGLYTILDWANTPCLGAAGAAADPGGLGCIVASVGGKMSSPTSCSVASNVATIVGANNLAVGDLIWVYLNAGSCIALNNVNTNVNYYTVTAASSSQISFALTTANLASTTVPSGVVDTIFQGDNLHPAGPGQQAMAMEYANIVNYLTGSTQQAPTVVTSSTHSIVAGERYISTQGSGSQTLTLPSCYGYSANTPFTVYNTTDNTVNILPPTGFNLNGGSSAVGVGQYQSVVFRANITSSTASGCYWSSSY